MSIVDSRRISVLRPGTPVRGPVVYWMIRDQRVADNWALLHARDLAAERRSPLAVVFALPSSPVEPTLRQSTFMLEGLREMARDLRKKNVAFFLLTGPPAQRLAGFVKRADVAAVVTDFSPLRQHCAWQRDFAARVRIPVFEVDAHNVVPCRFVSPKLEYAAYTLRSKIGRVLGEFLTDFPVFRKHPHVWPDSIPEVNWDGACKSLRVDRAVGPVAAFAAGAAAARKTLKRFVERRLVRYADDRNDPALDGQSELSPYLHFGQIAPQRVAWEVQLHDTDIRSQEAFLEELIVRRELSDNFCLHNDAYDSVDGFPAWARETLETHRRDPRRYVYNDLQLESGETHDSLWNAAQRELVTRGKMHGYMRMYWAKKMLEWTESAEEALRIALHLNDKYSLDGSDPNGYAGVAWSVGGVHDRPWFEREIFGKVRYMSYDGCRRKFDVAAYVRKVGA